MNILNRIKPPIITLILTLSGSPKKTTHKNPHFLFRFQRNFLNFLPNKSGGKNKNQSNKFYIHTEWITKWN